MSKFHEKKRRRKNVKEKENDKRGGGISNKIRIRNFINLDENGFKIIKSARFPYIIQLIIVNSCYKLFTTTSFSNVKLKENCYPLNSCFICCNNPPLPNLKRAKRNRYSSMRRIYVFLFIRFTCNYKMKCFLEGDTSKRQICSQ